MMYYYVSYRRLGCGTDSGSCRKALLLSHKKQKEIIMLLNLTLSFIVVECYSKEGKFLTTTYALQQKVAGLPTLKLNNNKRINTSLNSGVNSQVQNVCPFVIDNYNLILVENVYTQLSPGCWGVNSLPLRKLIGYCRLRFHL